MKVFKIVFTSIGALFLIVAISVFISKRNFMKRAVKTQGKVVYAGQTATIAFLDANNNEVEFSPNLKCNPPCYELNEIVDVYYDKDNVDDVMISGFTSQYLLVLIFGILGTIFFSIGFGFIIFPIINKGKGEKLKKFGIQLETTLVDIKKNQYIRVNRRHPYNIVTEWVDENDDTFQFTSSNIWKNPKKYIEEDTIIIVYVDKNNFNKYYMDISFLEN